MWTRSSPRTKRRTGAFAARLASGNHARRIVGTAASVRTRKDFSAAAERYGTRSTRPGCVRAADINGSGPRACGVQFGRCMRTGTQATTDERMRVSLVVDKEYGPRLQALVASGPVWIVDTESNRKAAEDYWQSVPEPERNAAVTTFKSLPTSTASESCLNILAMLDLHHGGYSLLEVIGVPLSHKLKIAIKKLGFKKFEPTAEGFCASR